MKSLEECAAFFRETDLIPIRGVENAKESHYTMDYTQAFPDLTVSVPVIRYPEEEVRSVLSRHSSLPRSAHSHNFFLLIFMLNGSMAKHMDGQWHEIGPDDLLLIPPGVASCAMIPFGSMAVYLNIAPRLLKNVLLPNLAEDALFAGSYAGYITDSPEQKSIFFREAMNADIRQDLTLCLNELAEISYMYRPKIRSLMLQLFIDLARTQSASSLNSLTGRIIGRINEDAAHITLQELARSYHYTPEYLSGMIRRETGCSFQELRTDIRLARGQQLLEAGQMSVEAIAEELGYADKSSFYRAFRKRYGCSPRT